MKVQLYRTDVKNPEALVLDFTSDLMAEMFVPISEFFEDNRIRLKSIIANKLELTIEYFQGDQVVALNLHGSKYFIFTTDRYNVLALKEEDLEKSNFTDKEPEEF